MEIQRIIRNYFEETLPNKLENLKGMDKLPDTYKLPRLNQEDIGNVNRSLAGNETDTVTRNLPARM